MMQWDATASFCCYIHFCRPTERGCVSPLSTVPAGTAGTAAVCSVLGSGRGLSVHHFFALLPVITWSRTNSRFMQHVYSIAAFAMTRSSGFQSILVSLDRSGDVFSSLQASICITCARLFLQLCPMDFTYERVCSICCFFSKFLSQNCKFENSDMQVKFRDESSVQSSNWQPQRLDWLMWKNHQQRIREAVGSAHAAERKGQREHTGLMTPLHFLYPCSNPIAFHVVLLHFAEHSGRILPNTCFFLSKTKKAILHFLLIWPCHSSWLGGQLSVEIFTGYPYCTKYITWLASLIGLCSATQGWS